MQQSTSKAYAIRVIALVFTLFFNVAHVQVQAKTSACADCAWLKQIVKDGQDEDASVARTKALTSLSDSDLKRAAGALATWIKNPATQEYDLAVLTARTLVEGHSRWSCDLTQQLKSSWPKPSAEPDLLTAKLSQLEVMLDAKCPKTFSGSAVMARVEVRNTALGSPRDSQRTVCCCLSTDVYRIECTPPSESARTPNACG
ncbi:MAG: hypothetical protein IPJ84_05260 [Bdellovibrionales bacterium]|nr:hypothetical protein [Bdellovibrionales bacterium]